MPAPTTLAECREDYEAQVAKNLPVKLRILINRSFMSGAIAAVELQKSGVPLDAVLCECVQFGRAVGTAAEQAAS